MNISKLLSSRVRNIKKNPFLADLKSQSEFLNLKIQNQKVLIIGGAGTIGSSYIKQVLKYTSILDQYSWAILPIFCVNNRKSSCHLFQLRINGFEEQQRDELMSRLASLEIGVNVHYIPLPMMSYFKSIGLDIKDFPSTYNLYQNEITLPLYNNLSLEKVEYICLNVVKLVNKIIESNEHK